MALAGTLILPEWPAPPRVRAFVTTRESGDMARPGARRALDDIIPAPPVWLRQVHGTRVVDADARPVFPEADAAVARRAGSVCAVIVADCLPVLLADDAGGVVAAAHAGWRGLARGVVENAVRATGAAPARLLAWLGPAIGPSAYEVGEEVYAAFAEDPQAFTPTRPGHWRLDLYGAARARLARLGVERIYGGTHCTYREAARFFSWRRERAAERMAALIWLA